MKNVCLTMRVTLAWIFVFTTCLYGADVGEHDPPAEVYQVRVVYLPAGGGSSSALYNVTGMTVCKQFEVSEQPCVIIQPVLDALKDEYLRGFRRSWWSFQRSTITQAKLSLKNADLTGYNPCRFESEVLRVFLMEDIPKMHTHERVSFEDGFQELQKDAFAKLGASWKLLRWCVVEEDAIEKDMQENSKERPTVYIRVCGEKVLKGTLTFGVFSAECHIDSRSLLHHKLSDTWEQLEKIYSYSPEKHRHCINYTGPVPLESFK